MSIKVYEAYRVKKGVKLWPLLAKIRRLAEARATRDLRDLYASLIDTWSASPKAWLEARKALNADTQATAALCPKPDARFASRFVRTMYEEQLRSYARNPFDFNTAVAVRSTGARYVLIPYPGSGLSGCLTFMRRLPELEDYHYQNAADKPDSISAAEWAARARVWNRLLDDRAWHDKLVLNIVTNERFVELDPVWIDARRAARTAKAIRQRRRS